MKILVLNAGSSTLKVAIYEGDPSSLQLGWKGMLEWDSSQSFEKQFSDYIIPLFKMQGPIDLVGHRVVHGGEHYAKPLKITPTVVEAIKGLSKLAPLHNPLNLLGIEFVSNNYPALPQVAVFDTAFHQSMPEEIKTYPIPLLLRSEGILKYGFHGISHQYCVEKAAEILGKPLKGLRILTCHLGNGSSLAAVKEGRCHNTTMGFTPLEGLMMGTRSGSIDPGILLYLQREKKISEEELDRLLNKASGLKGIAGTEDMRELLARRKKGDRAAALAIAMFVERLKEQAGAMILSLGGVDAIAYTGGIGEHAVEIRSEFCQSLAFLGFRLDAKLNESLSGEGVISESSSLPIVVVSAREEYAIAKACAAWSILDSSSR